MADNNAVLTWNANTEPDLAGYNVFYGLYPLYDIISSGVVVTNGTTITGFSSDGTWYFRVYAFDTSNNTSEKSEYASKRIVRTASKMVVTR